jgi:hypothetical protein
MPQVHGDILLLTCLSHGSKGHPRQRQSERESWNGSFLDSIAEN